MLATLPASQLVSWLAYQEVEPFGETRDDWHFAALMSQQANINRNTKRRLHPYETKDFLLRFSDPTPVKKDWKVTKKSFFAVLKEHAEALERAKTRKERTRRR